jgi:hypothetical protein
MFERQLSVSSISPHQTGLSLLVSKSFRNLHITLQMWSGLLMLSGTEMGQLHSLSNGKGANDE